MVATSLGMVQCGIAFQDSRTKKKSYKTAVVTSAGGSLSALHRMDHFPTCKLENPILF